MKISRTVLERRFFELNDDRNGCQRNLKEIMQKLYRIIMRLCDWKLIPMIEVIYFIYNIGLIHTSNGEHTKALEYYFRALERNPFLPQAFNNMAVICHYVRLSPLWKKRLCTYISFKTTIFISCRKQKNFIEYKSKKKMKK